MTPEQIAAVAGKLTKAQRDKLAAICACTRGHYRIDHGNPGPLLGKALVNVHSRYGHPFAKVWLEPTPLGRDVCAHLEKESRL